MKILSIFLFILISLSSFGADLIKCQEHFTKEFNEALRSDNGLINAQLALTALKLAKRIKPEEKNLTNYINSILSNDSIATLRSNTQTDDNALVLLQRYKSPRKIINREVTLDRLRDEKEVSDSDLVVLINELQINKNEGEDQFNENDIAIASLVANSHEASTGRESYFISSFIEKLLNGNSSENIARGFKKARLELKKEMNKLKAKVYSKYKEDCLDYFGNENKNSQNVSIFNTSTCSMPEREILNSSLLDSIEAIVKKENLTLRDIKLKIPTENKPYTSLVRRKIQDELNQLETNKEKIVEYYRKGLSQNNCDGFAIVDKKNNRTSVYADDGEEIMSVKSIIGVGKRSKYLEFNKDSILRKWPVLNSDGKVKKIGEKSLYAYSKTTGAGTYHIDKTLNPAERRLRKYDKEFNDRVLVLYSKTKDGKKEEIQAIHGVPNTGWINNRDERMSSFDTDNVPMNLSAGCVNLEGYSYDILDEFIGNNCPVYILPQDEANLYIVKNGELNFTTTKKSRKTNREPATEISSDGVTRPSTENKNEYRFTPLKKENSIRKIKFPNQNNKIAKNILINEKEIFSRAKLMDAEDFEDLLAITMAIENDTEKAKRTLLNLYNAQYRAGIPVEINIEEKRKQILQRYKADFDKNIDVEKSLSKSLRVNYEY